MSQAPTATASYHPAIREERVALVDLLDRVLAGGVVIVGDVTLSIADVDLVTVSHPRSDREDRIDPMALEARMAELRDHFGLTVEDLNLDLGPLGPLLPREGN